MMNDEEDKVEDKTEFSGTPKTAVVDNVDIADEPVSGAPARKKVKKENFDAQVVLPS